MGIAYGNNCFRKPLLETGRADYFGPLANLAARVMSCAHGGQVPVSYTHLTLPTIYSV